MLRLAVLLLATLAAFPAAAQRVEWQAEGGRQPRLAVVERFQNGVDVERLSLACRREDGALIGTLRPLEGADARASVIRLQGGGRDLGYGLTQRGGSGAGRRLVFEVRDPAALLDLLAETAVVDLQAGRLRYRIPRGDAALLIPEFRRGCGYPAS